METEPVEPPSSSDLRELFSFDRSYRETCLICQPDRWRTLERSASAPRSIARGAGLSYVAASFGDGSTSIDMRRFNRIVGFDQTGRWIEVEAGANLGDLYKFLSPRGLYLSVQPGHPQITIGGCIAGNVHGKNQFLEGLFQNCVINLKLFHPAYGHLDLSREKNSDLFELTCGGLGLTGLITSAKLRLDVLPGRTVSRQSTPVESLLAGVAEIDRSTSESDMTYGWFDLTAKRGWGKGYVAKASLIHREKGDLETEFYDSFAWRVLDRRRQRFGGLRVFNALSSPLINRMHRWGELHRGRSKQSLFSFLFPTVGKEIYYDAYGQRGFIEQQTLVPKSAVESYIAEFTRVVRKSDCPITLMTLKAFNGDARYLDYNGSGYSFGVDVPQNREAHRLLGYLDAINVEHGAKTYILKDSRLSTAIVERQYLGYESFKDALHKFDPTRHFRSALSRRLTL